MKNGPILTPPCRGWVRDLIKPSSPNLAGVSKTTISLNSRSTVFLEVSVSSLLTRGWSVPLGLASYLMSLFGVYVMFSDWRRTPFELQLIALAIFIVGAWHLLLCVRMDLYIPLNEPIRFNRARRKIYAYVLRPNWWMPWRPWPIEVVVYDWTQVRAEIWSRGSGGHRRCGTMLSIVKPGTNEVIDRFALNYMTTSEEPWLYVHTYMEKGPDALPLRHPPRPE